MGAYMAQEKLMPALAIVSPARRTIETWELASEHWKHEPELRFEDRIYEASADTLLRVIRAQESATPLMLVGHNPGLESLAAALLRRQERTSALTKFPTGALAVIDLPIEQWSELQEGTGALERFVTPRSIGVEKDGKD